MGIDWGEGKIGLALSDSIVSAPYKTLLNTGQVINEIAIMVLKEGIDKIVVGLPNGKMEQKVREFVFRLEKEVKVPIFFHDESWSTKEANRALFHTSVSRRKRLEHSVSAALILQEWLDNYAG